MCLWCETMPLGIAVPSHDCPELRLRFIKIDQEFLDSEQSSGTTATMCIVQKPKESGTETAYL